jgi:hypothetical protein
LDNCYNGSEAKENGNGTVPWALPTTLTIQLVGTEARESVNKKERMMSWLIPYAPLMSGFGMLLVAITAVAALFTVHRRTYRKSVDDRFDQLSVFFWTNQKIERGRDIISYDSEYEKVRRQLLQMTDSPEKPVVYGDAVRRDVEAINCLCACLTRVDLLKSLSLARAQKEQAAAIFGYWVGLVDGRPELNDYFQRYWVAPVGKDKRIPALSEDDEANGDR